jgi:hypothetical protein
MKINLNNKSSLSRSKVVVIQVLDELITEFCKDHDIKLTVALGKYFSDIRRGLPPLIEWSKTRGWKVEMWSLPDMGDGNGPAAYGLEFDDNCTLFMEARLKYS